MNDNTFYHREAEAAPSVPFYHKETEQAVLGSLLINSKAYFEVADILRANDFYLHRNRFVWDAIAALANDKRPIDLITVTNEIEKQGHLAEIGGSAYLTELLNASASSYHVAEYANTVADSAVRRRTVDAAQKALKHAYNESVSAAEARELAIGELDGVDGGPTNTDVEPLKEIIRKFDEEKDAGISLELYPTKSYELNRMLGGGLYSGRVALLAGEAKMGKTLLAQRIVREIAELGKPCLFVSQEMTKRDLWARLLSERARIPEENIHLGKFGGHEDAYFKAISEIEALPLFVSERSSWSIPALRAEVMRSKREYKTCVVLIDHVGLLADNPDRKSIHEQLDWKTQELKGLAKDAGVAVLAIYTLNASKELSGGASPRYNVDLAMKLESDYDYQARRPELERERAEIDRVWLTDVFRRYGAAQAAVMLKKDQDFPIIHDGLQARGM